MINKYLTPHTILMVLVSLSLAFGAQAGVIDPNAAMLVGFVGMTQMTGAQARVIDPILTTVAQGYKNGQMVGSALFPVVDVAARAGKILAFGKEAFQLYDTQRAPGGAVKRINVGYGSDNYALVDHALAASVPIELLEEASAVPSINLASAAITTVQDALALRLEKQQADLATNSSNYAASNKVTLSGTDQWSNDQSDPIKDVEAAKDAVRAKVGRRANTVVLGAAVFKSLKTNPKVIDRIKYTGRDVPTLELLAALFDVQRVLVGDAVVANASGTFSDVWGKNVVVAYTELGSQADMGRPSFGYTYRLKGYPYVSTPRWDGDHKTWLYDVADAVEPVIAGADAGFLISAAVA